MIARLTKNQSSRVETLFKMGKEGWEILLIIRKEYPDVPFYATLSFVEELQGVEADVLIDQSKTREEVWNKTLAWAKATLETSKREWNKNAVETAWLSGETPNASWGVF
jgi:hypothetical protein